MLKKYIVSLLLVLTVNLQALVSFYILKSPSGHLVLLLGDNHVQALDDINQDHVKVFSMLINACDASKPINCYIELSPETFKYVKLNNKSQEGSTLAKTMLDLSICARDLRNKSINFVPYEPRGKESDHVISGLAAITDKLFSAEAHNAKFEFALQMPSITLDQYLQSLNYMSQAISAWRNNYKKEDKAYVLIECLEKDFEAAKKEAQALFFNMQKDLPIEITLLQLIKNAGTIQAGRAKLEKISELLAQKLDFTYASLGFLNTILQEQARPKTIAVLGELHAQQLLSWLQKLNYKLMKSECIAHNVFNIKSEIRYSVNFDLSLYEAIIDFFTTKIENSKPEAKSQSSVISHLINAGAQAQASQDKPACTTCKKIETTDVKLKKCSRCKKLAYCSVECQKKDWAQHKVVCKSVA